MSIEYKVEVRNTELRELLLALYKDDNGICEEAHVAMLRVLERMFKKSFPSYIEEILYHVDAMDGRFFLPED